MISTCSHLMHLHHIHLAVISATTYSTSQAKSTPSPFPHFCNIRRNTANELHASSANLNSKPTTSLQPQSQDSECPICARGRETMRRKNLKHPKFCMRDPRISLPDISSSSYLPTKSPCVSCCLTLSPPLATPYVRGDQCHIHGVCLSSTTSDPSCRVPFFLSKAPPKRLKERSHHRMTLFLLASVLLVL